MAFLGQLVLLVAAVLLQSAWPSTLRPGGIAPDLALTVIVGMAVATRSALPLAWALLGGTLLDILSVLPAGTNVLGLSAAAGLAWLATAGPLRGQPWLVLPLPPLATVAAYGAAAWRLQLAGWSGAWVALLDVLPMAAVLVSSLLFAAWLAALMLGALRHSPMRL